MQLTLQQAQAIASSSIFSKSLPIQISYKFSKLGKLLLEELKVVEEQRLKLIQQCSGVLSEDQTQYQFTPENGQKFQEGMNLLLALLIEIPFEPLPLSALGENVTLTPNELLILEPLFIEE